MRPGFFVASLTLHAVVVGVVWRSAEDGLRPVTATSPSGLTALRQTARGESATETAEVEITSWQPPVVTPADTPANADVPSDLPNQPRSDGPTPQKTAAQTTTTKTAALAARTPPSPQARSPQAPSPKPRPAAAAAEQKPAADEWLSIEQQLPDEPASTADSPPAPTPKRDVLVERLLAKERDAQRLAAQDETRRRTLAASGSASSKPTPAPTATTPRVAEARAPASRDEVFGESRARANLWVELTRWLPRAASTDQTWEQLPANSSYEFRVELTTENGAIVSTRVLDRAPPSAERLLSQSAHLMSRGKYGGTRREVHRFELRVRLTTTTGRDLWIAHTTPDPPKPGVGSFIAPSGRRFDVWVTHLP